MTGTVPFAILLAEDKAIGRELCAMILEAEGYRVVTAGNGARAFHILHDDPSIDLLISDINMSGGMGGIELVQRLRNEAVQMPVILTSGHLRESYDDFPVDTAYLSKPYSRQELLAAVHAVLPMDAHH